MTKQMNEQKTDSRFPCWRVRVFQKFKDKWQPSYFGWHWIQDVIYVFDKTEEEAVNEMMDKIEWMLATTSHLDAQTIEVRYCTNKEELRQ